MIRSNVESLDSLQKWRTIQEKVRNKVRSLRTSSAYNSLFDGTLSPEEKGVLQAKFKKRFEGLEKAANIAEQYLSGRSTVGRIASLGDNQSAPYQEPAQANVTEPRGRRITARTAGLVGALFGAVVGAAGAGTAAWHYRSVVDQERQRKDNFIDAVASAPSDRAPVFAFDYKTIGASEHLPEDVKLRDEVDYKEAREKIRTFLDSVINSEILTSEQRSYLSGDFSIVEISAEKNRVFQSLESALPSNGIRASLRFPQSNKTNIGLYIYLARYDGKPTKSISSRNGINIFGGATTPVIIDYSSSNLDSQKLTDIVQAESILTNCLTKQLSARQGDNLADLAFRYAFQTGGKQ